MSARVVQALLDRRERALVGALVPAGQLFRKRLPAEHGVEAVGDAGGALDVVGALASWRGMQPSTPGFSTSTSCTAPTPSTSCRRCSCRGCSRRVRAELHGSSVAGFFSTAASASARSGSTGALTLRRCSPPRTAESRECSSSRQRGEWGPRRGGGPQRRGAGRIAQRRRRRHRAAASRRDGRGRSCLSKGKSTIL